MVPARPWAASCESGVLYTTTELRSSEGYWSNSTLRLSLVLTCSRPFRRAVVNPGSVPRRLIAEARPSARCEVNPGRRDMDSAMLVSGSLPMSSAETASTMLVESRLVAIAFSMPTRMPVTTTSPSSATWACDGAGKTAAAGSAAAIARRSRSCESPLNSSFSRLFCVRLAMISSPRMSKWRRPRST